MREIKEIQFELREIAGQLASDVDTSKARLIRLVDELGRDHAIDAKVEPLLRETEGRAEGNCAETPANEPGYWSIAEEFLLFEPTCIYL